MPEPTHTYTGWLAVADVYDGEDNYDYTKVELYRDGLGIGVWVDLVEELRRVNHKRVRVTVEVLDA